jgi:hypothetical protein
MKGTDDRQTAEKGLQKQNRIIADVEAPLWRIISVSIPKHI